MIVENIMSEKKIDVDELMHLIGKAVVNDEKIISVKWSAIAVSAIIRESSTDMNGFMYDEFGNSKPNTPCLLYTSPSPRDGLLSRMPSSA